MRVILFAVLAASLSACATGGGVPAPFPRPGAPAAAGGVPPAEPWGPATPSSLVRTALSFRGVPYRDGGASPAGFDCSGFVSYVFALHGRGLPRNVAAQYDVGERLPRDAVVAGDLVFFSTTAPGPTHVGIAISEDQFIHAPSSTGVVRIESLGTPYWTSRFLGARRIR